MRFYGTLESLIEYNPGSNLGYLDNPNKREEGPGLGNLLEEKVRCLSEILGDIEVAIKARGDLFGNLVYRIYQHYCYIKTKLLHVYQWEISGNRAIELRRSSLEKQLDGLKQEKRKEQVQCWQDIALLKKELRTWFKQYSDLVQRVKLVVPGKRGKRSLIKSGEDQKALEI